MAVPKDRVVRLAIVRLVVAKGRNKISRKLLKEFDKQPCRAQTSSAFKGCSMLLIPVKARIMTDSNGRRQFRVQPAMR